MYHLHSSFHETIVKMVIITNITIGRVNFNNLYLYPLTNNSVFLKYTIPTKSIKGIDNKLLRNIVISNVLKTIPINPDTHTMINVRDIK